MYTIFGKTFILVLGDLNGCLNPSIDRLGGRGEQPDSPLLQAFQSHGLHDIWRADHPHLREYTYLRADHASRIDYVLGSDELLRRACGSAIGSDDLTLGSDHRPVFAEFDGLGLSVRLPPAVREPRSELDREAIKAADWVAYTVAVDDIPDQLTHSLDLARRRPNGHTISTCWDALAAHICSAAQATLPYKTVGAGPSKFVMNKEGNAVRCLNNVLRVMAHPAGHEIRISHNIGRFRELLPEYAQRVSVLSTRAELTQVKTELMALLKTRAAQRVLEKIAAAKQKRCEDFLKHPGRLFDSLLDRRKPPCRIDHVRDAAGAPIAAPEAVKTEVSNFFRTWFSAPRNRDPLQDPDWAPYYAPLATPAGAFESLMVAPTVADLKDALKRLPNGKSAGPSSIPTELFRHLSPALLDFVRALFALILETGKMPSTWHCATIFPIPKNEGYNGNLDYVRPITLIDTGRKWFSTVLTCRLINIVEGHGLLKGDNYGSTPGVQALDPVHILQSFCEDAAMQDKDLYILSLDIKRAFDSVPFESLRLSLARLQVPESYINMIMALAEARDVRVITDHGLSPSFRPAKGIEQGEINAPLLWKIFYDPLLTRLKDLQNGYTLNAPAPAPKLDLVSIHETFPPMEGLLVDSDLLTVPTATQVNNVSFMDDLTLVNGTLESLRASLAIVESFMALHDIELNARKTVLAYRSRDPPVDPFLVAGQLVGTIYQRGEPFRVLGVWISTHCVRAEQIAQVQGAVHELARILGPKLATDKMVAAIFRSVVIPKALYPLTGICPTRDELDSIERPFRTLLKHFCGLPSSVSNSWLPSALGPGVPSLADSYLGKELSDMQVWMNSPLIVGQITRAHFRFLQVRHHYQCFPGRCPTVEAPKAVRSSKYLHLLSCLATVGLKLDCPLSAYNAHSYLHLKDRYVAEVVPPKLWKKIRVRLHQADMFFVAQFRSRLNGLIDWSQIKRMFREPVWWPALKDAMTVDGFTMKPELTGLAVEDATAAAANAEIYRSHAIPRPILARLRPAPAIADPPPIPISIWTDGSLDETRAYAGSACLTENSELRASFQSIPGSLSSTSAELGAILLALRSQPSNMPLKIISDSQSALAIARLPPHVPRTREAIKQPDATLRASIHSLLRQRTAPTLFEWVRGHSGDVMNERADAAANAGRLDGSQLLPPHVFCAHNQASLLARFTKLEYYGRWLIKLLARHAHTSVFVECSQGTELRMLPPAESAVTFAALRAADPHESLLYTSFGNSTFRGFRQKLMMGLLPTAQRSSVWRPDTYDSPLCPRCRLTEETSDHVFVCPANTVSQSDFAARFREEVAAALPAARVPEGRALADGLVASGLSLAGFRGTLSPRLSTMIRSVPSTLPFPAASLATLRALFRVAYEDYWKPRCAATIEIELRRGLTGRMKRLPPGQRPQVAHEVDLDNVPAVLHGHPHARSPSFSSPLETVQALWSMTLGRFLGEF